VELCTEIINVNINFVRNFFFRVLTILIGYKHYGCKQNFELTGVPGKLYVVRICNMGNCVQSCTTQSGYEPTISISEPSEIVRAGREATGIGNREITF
jgi:hypothetical protein